MTCDELLKQIKRIHFIGIGGSGMCPIAEILHKEGYIITGSDNNESDTLDHIRALGIPVILGQKAENIEGAEMIVHTAAIMDDNPELIAAKASGIPTFERSKLLGAVSRHYRRCVGISGTHGKTTTTSLLTHILISCRMDPTAVIGGKLRSAGTYGISGNSDIFVCEACEFKNTYHQISPSCSVILNIDNDHLDFFKTMDNLKASFEHFGNMASETVIYNGDDEATVEVVSRVKGKRLITFGLNPANDWQASDIRLEDGVFPSFDVLHHGEAVGRATLSIPGAHNVRNALAAFAAADYLGADISQAIAAAKSFNGAARRFEVLFRYNGITVADDYAHHPTELRATLSAAKEMNFRRVTAVFQPFTYSRTAMLLDDFADVLKIADKVIMTEIMGSREKNTWNIHTSDLAALIPGSEWYGTFEAVAQRVCEYSEPGDLVITLGCGDVYKIAKIIKNIKNGSLQ